ncbi:MAG: FAD-dependent monooxygenase [Betaproteobacteria bacterium]|jgi:Ubiquinone biosynthesis hydroxylase, UbiH/UbiF/VisC/COQ6 family|nr:FAD-dependent monooxygenase [Betaproteobacteria bacterium]
MRSDQPEWDVLIVGAGITGLALGLVLHQGGLRVRVMDRRPLQRFVPSPVFDTRIYAMNHASEAFLQRAGGWSLMDPARCQVIRGMEIRGDRQGHLALQAEPGQSMGCIVEAGAMLEGLRLWQQRVAPELLEEGAVSWDTVRQTSQAMVLEAGGRSYAARLLVACDGISSGLRAAMGIHAYFSGYGQTALVANYRIAGNHQGVARQWFLPGEVIALLPLPGPHVSLVWSARTDRAAQWLAQDSATRTALLQAQVGYGLGQLSECSAPQGFELRRMSVERWVLPRFALAGDAAHGVHPMAGQGLNLGLGDAKTLADILLGRSPGPDVGDLSLLRRYERARREPVARMQTLTAGLDQLFKSGGPWPALRNWGMRCLNARSRAKRQLIVQANQ